jgi:hypothetical protein
MRLVSPCGSSQMTPPSGRDATLGEKPPLPVGDAISRRLLLVRDSARFEWQPESMPVDEESQAAATATLPSVMKSVANLDKDFAGI